MLEPAPVLGLEESAPSAASSPHDDFWRKYEERSREELERALNEVRAAKRPWMETTREARAESSSESGRAASVARQQLERLETEQAWLEARLAQLTSRPFARP